MNIINIIEAREPVSFDTSDHHPQSPLAMIPDQDSVVTFNRPSFNDVVKSPAARCCSISLAEGKTVYPEAE